MMTDEKIEAIMEEVCTLCHWPFVEGQEALGEYKTFNDAQEAYGFGMITEAEFDQIVDFLENKEQMKSVRSPEEHAADLLQEYIIGLEREIASFEFDMLPQKEQERIRQQNFELLERRKKRMSGGTI